MGERRPHGRPVLERSLETTLKDQKERGKMEYQLEIYRPGSSDSSEIIRVFSAPVAFLPIRVGDLLNTKT